MDNQQQYTYDDSVLPCSDNWQGYPESSQSIIYEYLNNKPKPYKYQDCYVDTGKYPWEPKTTYKWAQCKGTIYSNASGNFKVKGTVKDFTSKTRLKYWAASPNTCTYSSSGAGLPFPNEEIAYENTPNKGEISLNSSGQFEILLHYPAGYYINQGETYIAPHVNFLLCDSNQANYKDIIKISLPFDTPFRSLGFNVSNPKREFQPVPFKK